VLESFTKSGIKCFSEVLLIAASNVKLRTQLQISTLVANYIISDKGKYK
jgi:hypothetical protein